MNELTDLRPRAEQAGSSDGNESVVEFELNGLRVRSRRAPITRLSDVLRDEFHLTGTKIGCNAGDCGACTVLVDGLQVCACLTSLGQAQGRSVTTVEGLGRADALSRLQQAFQNHGAAQCGICMPGMLMAAADLLARSPQPAPSQVQDALGGVLCRCTGYRKAIDAVLAASREMATATMPGAGLAVGARAPKVDGAAKLAGSERFGADAIPDDALWLRAVRSPHARATFTLGDMDALRARHPGIERVLTARDVPSNGFGIYATVKDQPVLADGAVRFRGEAVVALVGERAAVERIRDEEVPVTYHPQPALLTIADAQADGAPLLHADHARNVLIEGGVRKGDATAAFARCAAVAQGEFRTSFVEHAYIEPEAGWARRVRGPAGDGSDDRLEIHVSTQTPYMDRDEMAVVMRLAKERVRIVPTACGGGFGGKLDMAVQPLVGVAAWLIGRPVACVYTRPESMASTTKRHPAILRARFGADSEGRLQAVEVDAVFNTGAYASWGPTVANRVPVHATGPYFVPHVATRGTAIYTNITPAGAFRGFGVPQAAIAHEAMMDDLAEKLALDRLEIRRRNALRVGDATATGQVLAASCGLLACLDALEPHWLRALGEAGDCNAGAGAMRRGVGIGCMWYGIGNTSMSNPSEMSVGLRADGRFVLYNGCADIGQGTNTTMMQVCADALGVSMTLFDYIMGDTDRTLDAGKSSASRQAFVSGNAALLAGRDLRAKLVGLAGYEAADVVQLRLEGPLLILTCGGTERRIELAGLAADANGDVLVGHGRFDPPTTPLDENGQGVPYATYGYAAQMAIVEVDLELGTTRVLRMVAAHDVGRALNPQQVEGQIHGGIAQGLGMALMEEYIPGQTDNLHDYLIPTIGDVPPIETILIEDGEPLGPYGAKGVGEPALIPTPPAILGAIRHATGLRVDFVPVTPHRLRALLRRQSR